MVDEGDGGRVFVVGCFYRLRGVFAAAAAATAAADVKGWADPADFHRTVFGRAVPDRSRKADLPPSRVDQYGAIGIATERSAATRLKDSRPGPDGSARNLAYSRPQTPAKTTAISDKRCQIRKFPKRFPTSQLKSTLNQLKSTLNQPQTR